MCGEFDRVMKKNTKAAQKMQESFDVINLIWCISVAAQSNSYI